MRLRRTPLTAIATAVLSAGVLTAALITTGTAATAEPAGTSHPARAAQPAGVPWSHVGPGWVLAQYTTAAPEGGKTGPATLYLVSPGGAKYQLAHWPDFRTAPELVAWSPDGKRALFQVFSGKGGVEQLTLATGRMSTFVMQGNATPIGYTTPDGLNIVGSRPSGNGTIVARYSLSGRLVQSLGRFDGGQPLYAPSGTEFAAGASHGIKLVSNSGALIRQLPVPGTSANTCGPVRWWNSSTILASCSPPGSSVPRLWLVPVSGAHPKALTPPRNPNRSGDLGDLDAWQLSSGLYLQAAGPCGVLHIYRQAPGGSIKLITVPHTNGDNRVLTARGSRLLVEAPTDCTGSVSLLWYDPGTRAEQWLIRPKGNVLGVANAVPFYSRQNGDL
jgi:TolB protein